MSLPPPTKKKTAGPSMMDLNRSHEAEIALAEELTLDEPSEGRVARLSVTPIRQSTMDRFEALYVTLKAQRRSLKRYQMIEALLQALDEEPAVQREMIKRLRNL